MIGKTLGNFTIEAQIGKGGMGEVYKAKDQKLGRDVAIKVLPEEFAIDPDRVARFQREAKLLASLNHPNIAAIYGLEESDGIQFLVQELIEGETLAERVKGGPIPVEESLKLALQIAEALESAHENGVIHRDLKPANIKVTPDGKVKVLDFGLAKAFAGEQAEVNLSHSPTLSEAATMQGVILGTAAYMSPEQARGKPVDKRTDIWAFGCVLYEILTGKSAFQGEDVTEILAAVVKSGVNLDLLPANIHLRVREVIIRCLQKEQKKRYRDIGEAQYEIEQVLADPSGVFTQPVVAAKPKKKLRVGISWFVAAAILCVIIGGLAVWYLKPLEPKRVMRFEYELPEGQQITTPGGPLLAISPDGSKFVYCESQGLYLRSMDELDARLVSGVDENPIHPFFSPDGLWVGYWSPSDQQLKKVAISGGAPVTICDASGPMRPLWNIDGTIVYVQDRSIMKVSANGGTPELIVAGEEKPIYAPQILPDGKSVLFSIFDGVNQIAVQSLQSGERKILTEGINALYLPTGHLVYGLENNLLAVHFDLDTLELVGGPVPIVEGIMWIGGSTAPQYAVSDLGTLVYLVGSVEQVPEYFLANVDRDGKVEKLPADPHRYDSPIISPDGTRVAVGIESEEESNVWIYDITRNTLDQLTFEGGEGPCWTPDGKRVAFTSNRDGTYNIYWKSADFSGEAERLTTSENREVPFSWSPEGDVLIYTKRSPTTRWDIWSLSLEEGSEPQHVVQTEGVDYAGHLSPNGRWLAYYSTEQGQRDIYVQAFPPGSGGKWRISTEGGQHPKWAQNGKELFYWEPTNHIMAVKVTTDPAFSRENPVPLPVSPTTYWDWDVTPDGQRFLILQPVEEEEEAGSPKINVVVNWFEELKERVPVE